MGPNQTCTERQLHAPPNRSCSAPGAVRKGRQSVSRARVPRQQAALQALTLHPNGRRTAALLGASQSAYRNAAPVVKVDFEHLSLREPPPQHRPCAECASAMLQGESDVFERMRMKPFRATDGTTHLRARGVVDVQTVPTLNDHL